MDAYDIRTIENNIFHNISQYLDDAEEICASPYFSFHLPKGCKKLNWPQNTYVEIKYRLIYDSFTKIRNIFDSLNAEKLVVIVIIGDEFVNPIRNSNIPQRKINVVTYEKFITQLQKKSRVTKNKNNSNIKLNNYQEEDIIDKARKAYKNNKVSLFLGAGVSASAGIVTWDNLIEQLCIIKGTTKIDSDIDSVIKGRYIVDMYKDEKQHISESFYNDMKEILYANIHPSQLIISIAKLVNEGNVESIISYNYDNLVEQEISKTKLCYPVYDKSRPIKGNSLHIYHVHGFIPQEGEWSPIVLGEKEYHKIYQESYNWGNVEQLHALCRNICFFIGLSMKDPNLRRLIDISIDGSEVEPIHYVFLRRIEYDVPFMEKVMRGFGINCIWYDKHEDLPNLLNNLTK